MEADVEVTGNITHSNNKVVFILTSLQDEDYFCSVIQSVAEGIAFTFVKGKMSNEDINNAVKFCTNFIVNGIRAV